MFSHVTKVPGDLGPRVWAGLLQIYYSSILGADSTAGLLDNEILRLNVHSDVCLGNDA